MNRGELLTRLTIWLALCAYGIGAGMLALPRGGFRWMESARLAWTMGCAFFVAHVVAAFNFYHQWSHADAYRVTAVRTGELTGLRWGGGIYFNYIFAMLWLADVLWWWSAPGSFSRRSRALSAILHGYYFFMVFNGAVVFGAGPVRYLGAAICGGLAVLWWRGWSKRRHERVASRAPDG